MKSLIFVSFFALCAAAPQYQPFQYKKVIPKVYRVETSTLSNIDDGQYRPDNGGAYVHSDNPYRYQTVAAGKYYGDAGQYVHDNSGAYNGDDGQYHPDNSGAYNPDDSGRYIHSGDTYQHQGGAYQGNNRAGSPVTIYKPVAAATPVKVNSAGYKDYNNYGIIRKIEQVLEDGYHYIYETENGILGEEEGHLVNKGQDNEYMDVKGFYKYIGVDNVEYKVEYTVDAENGFVPRGDHIPQVPAAQK